MDPLADLRLAFRRLRNAPGFTVSAILILGLALGANRAIFGAVDAALLHPLPVSRLDRLVVGWGRDPAKSAPVVELSYRTFEQWAARNHSFSQVAAFGSSAWPMTFFGAGDSPPSRLSATAVTASFFDTLSIRPALGRSFRPEDDQAGAAPAVVLSHRVWIREFDGRPSVIGTTMRLEKPYTIVGVMPATFDFPAGTDLWVPVAPILAEAAATAHVDAFADVGVLFIIGRLRDGVTPSLASKELEGLDAQLAQSGVRPPGSGVVLTPIVEYLLGPIRQGLWALLAAVGVLLLIACANVSGLILARSASLRRDAAIRVALGATPADLSRQWLLEALILTFTGGILGLLASHWIRQIIVASAPASLSRLATTPLSADVAAFTFVSILVTALLCALVPTRDARRFASGEAAIRSVSVSQDNRAGGVRRLLVTFQIGLAVVLLIATALVVRSVRNVNRIDLGFTPSGVLTMSVERADRARPFNEWMARLLTRIRSLRGVQSAGAVSLRPLALGAIGNDSWIVLAGQPDTAAMRDENPRVNYQAATPGYFTSMGIRVVRGRLFTADDRLDGPRVALVSEWTAQRLWPGQDPIGKRLLMPNAAGDGSSPAWRTVIGVVSDVRYRGIDDRRLDVYDAAAQSVVPVGDLVIRTTVDPPSVAAAVRAQVRRLDPLAVVDRVTTMDAVVSQASAPWRFSERLFALFALVAAALAAIGLYGLVSLDVAGRRRELAVRLAIGAQRGSIIRLVLSRAALSAGVGLFSGLALAAVGTPLLHSILFEVDPFDVPAYAVAVAFVITVVGLASYVPARRAATVDPLVLLKAE